MYNVKLKTFSAKHQIFLISLHFLFPKIVEIGYHAPPCLPSTFSSSNFFFLLQLTIRAVVGVIYSWSLRIKEFLLCQFLAQTLGTNLRASLHCPHSVTYVYAEIDISKMPKRRNVFWNYSDYMQRLTDFKYSLYAPTWQRWHCANRVVRWRSRRINWYLLSKWDEYSNLAYREVHRTLAKWIYFYHFYEIQDGFLRRWNFSTVGLGTKLV